jgi:peptide deformylase
MAILNILEFPDPRLRTIAKPVDVVDDSIRQLVDDMFETMYDAPGLGLAATQVNVHKRVVVMDLSEDKSEPRVFINPEFEPLTDEMDQYQEGCLSVPGFYENVDRPQKVKIKALDRDGQPYELIAEGLLEDAGVYGRRQKEMLDQVAAQAILMGWFEQPGEPIA